MPVLMSKNESGQWEQVGINVSAGRAKSKSASAPKQIPIESVAGLREELDKIKEAIIALGGTIK